MKNVKVHSSSDSPNGSWGAGSQDVTALRAEIERLTAENERMRGAFRVIDSVIPSAIPGNSDTYVKMICARFIHQQLSVNSEEQNVRD